MTNIQTIVWYDKFLDILALTQDMKKFGGKYTLKQKCIRRRCHQYMNPQSIKMQLLAAKEVLTRHKPKFTKVVYFKSMV